MRRMHISDMSFWKVGGEGRYYMNISNLLELRHGQLVSIVGGGGKTSLMERLSGEIFSSGKNVLVTTTTAIYVPSEEWVHRLVMAGKDENAAFSETGGITALGSHIDELRKLRGVSADMLCGIKESGLFDVIIAESDGSKGRPVKAPAEHEPVIAPCSDVVVGVIGVDCIGMIIDDMTVHRLDEFCSITGKKEGDIIDCGDIAKLIVSPFGIFKGGENAKKHVVLNKVEGEMRAAFARDIIDMVKNIHTENESCADLSQIEGIFAVSLKEGGVDKIWIKRSKSQE